MLILQKFGPWLALTAAVVANLPKMFFNPKLKNFRLSNLNQKIENLNKACPNNLGDWYFTGNYPTEGGNKVANRSFMNYCDGISERAY